MKLPEKVRITYGTSYKVEMVEALDKPTIMGDCDPDLHLIRICSTLSERQILVTFIHELLHALQFEYGIKIAHSSIDQLDEAIERLLRLNGWL